MKFIFVFLLTISIAKAQEQTIHILFVGNSLTYTNNIPELVAQIGKTHDSKIKTEMLALPDYALEDHWNDGKLQKLIASKKFQFVVVQQGPSSQSDGRTMLLEYGKRIKTLCEKNNSRLAFFMVWPARMHSANFDGVIANYTEAANETGSILCAVGKVWKTYFDETQDYSYYGPDGFHPSPRGSQIAAQVIYDSLFR